MNAVVTESLRNAPPVARNVAVSDYVAEFLRHLILGTK
jgi:hypothetical protein